MKAPAKESVNVMNLEEPGVYPNPCKNELNVLLPSNDNKEAWVAITSLTGEKLIELTIVTNQWQTLRLEEPDGIYMLTITTDTQALTKKLIIMH